MKLTRATPPITPPTMGPVLLGLAGVDGLGAVVGPVLLRLAGVDGWGVIMGPEGLSELVVDCFVLGVGVLDCGSVSVVVRVVELEVGMMVTDAAAWVCEIVFATSAGLECQVIPPGPIIPEPSGSAASSA
jgi:hypothetical protein